jgi:hypothetical protein
MWNCHEGDKRHMQFTVSEGNTGVIRLASRPTKCLGIPPDKTKNGVWIQLWPCDAPESQMSLWAQDCSWGKWSGLSECSEPCGGGVRSRHRQAIKKGWKWGGNQFVRKRVEECEGPNSESVTCNTDQCAPEPEPRPKTPETAADSCAAYGCRSITPGQSCQCHSSCKEVGSCCLDFDERCGANPSAGIESQGGKEVSAALPATTRAATTVGTTSTTAWVPPAAAALASRTASQAGPASTPRRAAKVNIDPNTAVKGGRVPVGDLDQQESVWQAWQLHPRSFTTAFVVTFMLFLPICCWFIPLVLRKSKRRECAHYKPANSQVDGLSSSKDARRGNRYSDEDLDGVQVRFPEPEDSD